MTSSDGRAPRPLVIPPRTIPVSEPELARLPLFEGISLEELMLMSGCLSLSRRDFDESQTIILAEQRVSLVGAIVEGSVQMVTQDIDGNESIFACLYPGELVGESFACGPTQPPVSGLQPHQPHLFPFLQITPAPRLEHGLHALPEERAPDAEA